MTPSRLTYQVCRWRNRFWWRSLQAILPRGGAHVSSHRRRGAKVCSWETDLEALGDKVLETMNVEEKQEWSQAWGGWPVSWWELAKDRSKWQEWIVEFVKRAPW